MAERQRVRLVAPLVNRPVGLALPFRNPTPEDLPALAELLLSAYEGTIDYGRGRASPAVSSMWSSPPSPPVPSGPWPFGSPPATRRPSGSAPPSAFSPPDS